MRRRPWGVYRTNQGTVFRVSETSEGGLKVEVLEGEIWVPGRVSLVGQRLSASTTKLDAGAIAALPA